MGRRHLHKPDDVLRAAMHAFHSGGFAQTSSRDLQVACGVHAGSLYNNFGSKEALFIAALQQYLVEVVDLRVQQYLMGEDAPAGLTEFFATAFNGPPSGCLLSNACAEFGDTNAAIAAIIRAGFKKIEDGFRAQLLRDRRYASFGADELKKRAHALLLSFQGYLVIARVNASPRQRRAHVRVILSCLLEDVN